MTRYEKTNKLRSRILRVLFIIFVLLAVSVMYIIYLEQNKLLESFKNTIQDHIEKTVDYTFKKTINKYQMETYSIIKNLYVGSYVYSNDRDGLYNVLKPKLDQLQDETYYFKTLHFIKADGTSFLRVHKRDHFGDAIIKRRLMVQAMMREKKPLIGYETGIHATVFRILIPVFYQNKFLGSLGLGIEPGYIMEEIGRIVKLKSALFIENDELKLYKEQNRSDLHINNFSLQTQLDEKSLKIFKKLSREYNFEKDFLLEHNGRKYFFHTVDVENFKGDVNAKLVFFQDITQKLEELKDTQFYIAWISLFFLLVAFFIVRYFIIRFGNNLDYIYNEIIKESKEKEQYLQAVEDNSSNIIVTSTLDVKITNANKRFFEFTGFSSLSEFKKEYGCICDLFIPRSGYLSKEIAGANWLEYIQSHQQETHKVIMLKDSKEKVFKVTTSLIATHQDGKVYVSTFVDITEIEEIRSRLTYAINGTTDGIWDWNIITDEVYFSPRLKEMLGYEDHEMESSFASWEEKVHPDDIEHAVSAIEANKNKETKRYRSVHRLRHKDEYWVWILDRGQAIFNEDGEPIRMVGFHTDITEQKEKENLIHFQAQRSEALLELPQLAQTLVENEFLQKAQAITERLTKSDVAFLHFINEEETKIESVIWSDQTLQKSSQEELNEISSVETQRGIWSTSMRSKKPLVVNNYQFSLKRQGLEIGDSYFSRLITIPILEAGKVVMVAGVGNKKEAYDSLDVETLHLISNDMWRTIQRLRSVQELKQKDKMMLAQSRNAAMGEMISMIAHQWRQPLAAISMSSNNILADIELDMIENETLEESCKEILEHTSELSKTIDDFREFFKPVKKSEIAAPKDILHSALKIVGKSLENSNVKVIENISSEKEIDTYSRELMQVFLNILNNAKEVVIENKKEDRKIEIEIKETGDSIVIKICDNGGGIPDGVIDKVFEPYFSTKDERTGTGLGLYMSKTIVEKHHGGVLSVSNENEGACFLIELPFTLPKSTKKE